MLSLPTPAAPLALLFLLGCGAVGGKDPCGNGEIDEGEVCDAGIANAGDVGETLPVGFDRALVRVGRGKIAFPVGGA